MEQKLKGRGKFSGAVEEGGVNFEGAEKGEIRGNEVLPVTAQLHFVVPSAVNDGENSYKPRMLSEITVYWPHFCR